MPSSKARFLTLLQIGLICITINGILLYIIVNFVVIPYLSRNPEAFEQMFYQKQTSSPVHTVETPRSTTQIYATVIPNPTYFCDTRSCSITRYRNT